MSRVGGIISVKVNGITYNAKGSWTVGFGKNSRETIIGDSVHGYSEKPTAPFIEGVFTDNAKLDIDELDIVDATITVDLPTGKLFTLFNAWSTNPLVD